MSLTLSHCRHAPSLLAFALAGALCAGTATPSHANSPWCAERCDELVLDWNATAHQVIKADDGYANPLAASRTLAMMHLAMHDALNAVTPQYTTYTQVGPGRDADRALAAVTAAHDVLLALYPAQKELLRANLDKSALDAGSGRAAQLGSELGSKAAAAVVARRSADGSAGSEPYREGRKAGEYRFVPGSDALFASHWRQMTPFALRSPQQFRVAAPPALGSAAYTRAFQEVKDSGGKEAGARRSADQTNYAAFWYEFSEAGWNRIARVVSRGQPQDLQQRARTFALLNVAMADAYVAGWDSKLHHNFWRPGDRDSTGRRRRQRRHLARRAVAIAAAHAADPGSPFDSQRARRGGGDGAGALLRARRHQLLVHVADGRASQHDALVPQLQRGGRRERRLARARRAALPLRDRRRAAAGRPSRPPRYGHAADACALTPANTAASNDSP